ncbi:hypothetical protein [Halorussus lipolyticus]|uniref:hypothetical protein n=1 Tax=Halorussus lipolyticus TaxID=3034024 RepID=UPI0023E78907|nr:hypothetical protein [Halorussus sp. DT80]
MTRSQTDQRDSSAGSDLPDLPAGTLVRSRVESDLSGPLSTALDRELTGYAVLEPQDALLLDADGAGVVAFEKGVPRFAYHTGTGRVGPKALADAAGPGPYDVALRELPGDDLTEFDAFEDSADGTRPDLRVPPGMPADRLAGDPDLAERTRAVAPPEWSGGPDGESRDTDETPTGTDESLDAVEAFLEDDEKIEAIRDRAREEARDRAEQWGLDGQLR